MTTKTKHVELTEDDLARYDLVDRIDAHLPGMTNGEHQAAALLSEARDLILAPLPARPEE